MFSEITMNNFFISSQESKCVLFISRRISSTTLEGFENFFFDFFLWFFTFSSGWIVDRKKSHKNTVHFSLIHENHSRIKYCTSQLFSEHLSLILWSFSIYIFIKLLHDTAKLEVQVWRRSKMYKFPLLSIVNGGCMAVKYNVESRQF